MRKFGVIAKEVGICLLLLIVALGVDAFLFKDVYFKTMDVPAANEYSTINRDLYKVVGDIQDAQNATQTYEVSSSQIENDLTEYRYTPGTVNPFVSSSSVNDLPTETIGGGSGDVQE